MQVGGTTPFKKRGLPKAQVGKPVPYSWFQRPQLQDNMQLPVAVKQAPKVQQSNERKAAENVQKLVKYKGYTKKDAERAVRFGTAKKDLKDIETTEYRASMHPDFKPSMSAAEQQALSGDGSLRARLLRGANMMSNQGTALDIPTAIASAPGRAFANFTTNAEQQYFNPNNSIFQNTLNLGLDLFDMAPTSVLKGVTSIGKSVNKVIPGRLSSFTSKPSSVLSSTNQFDLEELRRAYHNSERFLQPEEVKVLHKYGHGLRENYRSDMSNFGWGTNNWNPGNQLPPPPAEIRIMPDGSTQELYALADQIDPIAFDWTTNFRNRASSYNVPKPAKKIVNKSGLTKEEVLQKASAKDKDVLSKMSETEFENTVLKPTGEVVPYESQADLMQRFTGTNNVFAMSPKQYADAFNEKLDLLNEIIRKRNRSGVEYRVKGLDERGQLTFHTPEQNIPVKLTDKQKANVDWFTRDPKDWLINKAGLRQEGNIWKFSDETGGDTFNSIEEAIEFARNELKPLIEPKIISGESSWGVRINPGQWRGNVEDIANTEYFRSIPGLEMSNTTSGVFADNVARKGTGAYESINDYLKQLDLGRVKPGFNSQTEFSRGAWENFIKSGRGVGFYANPKTVYGTMKTLVPPAAIVGAAALPQNKEGGIIYNGYGNQLPKAQVGKQQKENVPYNYYQKPQQQDNLQTPLPLKQKDKEIAEEQAIAKIQKEKGVSRGTAIVMLRSQQRGKSPVEVKQDRRFDYEKQQGAEKIKQIQKYRKEELGIDPNVSQVEIDYNTKKANRIIDNIVKPIEAASTITGIGSIGSNLLRLGASQLERAVGRNLVSRVAKNTVNAINPVINTVDETLAYAQLDPIGIMGNKLNTRLFNPNTALNTTTNTVTGVGRNLNNSAVEAADVVAGVNNTENIARESVIPSFKSEIDWAKWNPDTPKYPELINEYNAIEESTKKAGTWMKNPDGSPFQGTPEQFIQQQSSYFKKAFGESLTLNEQGIPQIFYHGSRDGKVFEEFKAPFDIDKSQRITNNDAVSIHNYFSPSKSMATKYAKLSTSLGKEPKVYEVYANVKNPYVTDNYGQIGFPNKIPNVSEYDAVTNLKLGKNDIETTHELLIPYKNYVKSAVGNVGFFDMTNPNIYKALVPTIAGAAALQEKRKGGPIVDPRGQWAHPGKHTIVPTPTGQITMRNVNRPVFAVDETGYSQMMYPEQEYQFPGKMVYEIPMMQKGGISFNNWKKKYNLSETPDYNLKRAWELGYVPDKSGHLPSVDEQTLEWLKSKDHPTLRKELNWYKGNSSEAKKFRDQYNIDSSGQYWKYVPRLQKGGLLPKYQTIGQVSVPPPTRADSLTTPEAWEKSIKELESEIGHPDKWTIDKYFKLQNKLNQYKSWRNNTPEGRSVVDYHNEPNEYVIPLPAHLKNDKLLKLINSVNFLGIKFQNGGGTLVKDKTAAQISQPTSNLNLRPVFDLPEIKEEYILDPSCPDPEGLGCSYIATREAQKITGLPLSSYGPANAGYRDAVAKRTGMQEIFQQIDPRQIKKANSKSYGWHYPTQEDFSKWKAGDIVTLDAGDDEFKYSAPKGYSERDNAGNSHVGVIVGFTKEGRPIIRHGLAKGKGKGKVFTEVLGEDNRVTSLGHGRYAIKSVWRPKEINSEGNTESVIPIVEKAEDIAKRKQATNQPAEFYLKDTPEEQFASQLPVAAAVSYTDDKRLSTKNNLVNLFNDKKLDKDLQYKLGITSEELNNLKPVVYGIAGQESNFNDPNFGGEMKDFIGSILAPKNTSKGLFQVKYNSLTKKERDVLGIKSPKDLLDDKKAYQAAILLMKNAKQRVDKEVEQGTHPELADKDPYFRAAYYYNSPLRAITDATTFARNKNKSLKNKMGLAEDVTPEQAELRMDKGSYPYKLMQKAKDLGVDYDMETPTDLEEIIIYKQPKNKNMNVKRLKKGGSTYNGGVWFKQGGMPCYNCGGMYMGGGDIPNYMQDPNSLYNFGGYFPQAPRFGMGGNFIPYPSINNYTPSISEMKQGGIHIDPSKKGTFTAAATRAGMGVQAFASKVLSAPEGRYSPGMRKKANFAKNAAGWKKEEGGLVEGQIIDVTPDMLERLKMGGYTFEIVND